MYEIVGMCVYFAAFFYIQTAIKLKKREMIDGVQWLDSWTIRDLDYSEELLWGVEKARLLDYTISTQSRTIEEYIVDCETFLTEIDKEEKEKDKKETKEEKEKDKKEKKEEKISEKEKQVIELSKSKSQNELRGHYYYLVKLAQETSFEDTEEHAFKKAIFVTSLPWAYEFNFSRLQLEVEGYIAKGSAAKCALNIEKWLTDDRPLVTVAWTESATLELKGKMEKDSDHEIHEKTQQIFTAFRSLVNNFENKTERIDLTEKKWKNRAEGFKELYEESEQFWEIAHDDYFNQNAYDKKKVLVMKKSSGIFISIVFLILLILAIAFFMK
jgi:hypothetical protein